MIVLPQIPCEEFFRLSSETDFMALFLPELQYEFRLRCVIFQDAAKCGCFRHKAKGQELLQADSVVLSLTPQN